MWINHRRRAAATPRWTRPHSLLSHLFLLVQASANEELRLKWLFLDFKAIFAFGTFYFSFNLLTRPQDKTFTMIGSFCRHRGNLSFYHF